MTDFMSLLALVRLRYRTWKLRALMWALRHLMGQAERLSRQGGSLNIFPVVNDGGFQSR
jgi:hypothetical protein